MCDVQSSKCVAMHVEGECQIYVQRAKYVTEMSIWRLGPKSPDGPRTNLKRTKCKDLLLLAMFGECAIGIGRILKR